MEPGTHEDAAERDSMKAVTGLVTDNWRCCLAEYVLRRLPYRPKNYVWRPLRGLFLRHGSERFGPSVRDALKEEIA